MEKLPKLSFMTLSRDAGLLNANKTKVIIIDPIPFFTSSKFPFDAQFNLTICLVETEKDRTYKLSIRLVDSEGNETTDDEIDITTNAENYFFAMKYKLNFKKEGYYKLKLYIDDTPIGEHPIIVYSKEGNENGGT